GSAGLGNSRSRVTVVVGDAGGGRGASGASKRWLYSHRAPAPCNRTEAPTANQTHPGTGRRVSPKSIGLTAGPSASLIIMAVVSLAAGAPKTGVRSNGTLPLRQLYGEAFYAGVNH